MLVFYQYFIFFNKMTNLILPLTAISKIYTNIHSYIAITTHNYFYTFITILRKQNKTCVIFALSN